MGSVLSKLLHGGNQRLIFPAHINPRDGTTHTDKTEVPNTFAQLCVQAVLAEAENFRGCPGVLSRCSN